jgi:TRAP-type mannitol/chloroaromatic compound transport system permease small subunit
VATRPPSGSDDPPADERGAADPLVIEEARPGDWLPETGLSQTLDRAIDGIGVAVSFLWPIIILAIVGNVIARYALARNIGQLEELQWHLYAIAFLVGLSFAASRDQHIRIDVLYASFPAKAKAWIELIGLLVFAVPFTYLILRYAWPFFIAAYEIGERSEHPSGLPHRWIVKSVLFVAFFLLAVAFFSRLSRVSAMLFGFPRAKPPVG